MNKQIKQETNLLGEVFEFGTPHQRALPGLDQVHKNFIWLILGIQGKKVPLTKLLSNTKCKFDFLKRCYIQS